MKITALLAAVMATTTLAAPSEPVRSMAVSSTWTITNMKRSCNKADDSCNWSFGIQADSKNTACAFIVHKSGATPASKSPETGAECGDYTVTSGWSGQFGPGKGFTTLSVVNNPNRRIAWPAYTDKQLADGKVVKPDQSYPVQSLP